MQLLQKLEQVGYRVALEGESVRLTWRGPGKPDPATVKPLLEELKRRKEEVLALLAAREAARALGLPWDPAQGLTKPVRIGVAKPEWQAVLGRSFWLAPNQAWAGGVRRKYPEALVFTVAELIGLLPDLREKGPEAPGLLTLIQAKRMFAGTIMGEPA